MVKIYTPQPPQWPQIPNTAPIVSFPPSQPHNKSHWVEFTLQMVGLWADLMVFVEIWAKWVETGYKCPVSTQPNSPSPQTPFPSSSPPTSITTTSYILIIAIVRRRRVRSMVKIMGKLIIPFPIVVLQRHLFKPSSRTSKSVVDTANHTISKRYRHYSMFLKRGI